MKIIVVDDDGSFRNSLRISLAYDGYMVRTAWNPAQALNFVERDLQDNETWDLIISDWQMPDKDGAWLLQEIKKRGLNIPVVIISGGDEKDAQRALELGARRFIPKSSRTAQEIHSFLKTFSV